MAQMMETTIIEVTRGAMTADLTNPVPNDSLCRKIAKAKARAIVRGTLKMTNWSVTHIDCQKTGSSSRRR